MFLIFGIITNCVLPTQQLLCTRHVIHFYISSSVQTQTLCFFSFAPFTNYPDISGLSDPLSVLQNNYLVGYFCIFMCCFYFKIYYGIFYGKMSQTFSGYHCTPFPYLLMHKIVTYESYSSCLVRAFCRFVKDMKRVFSQWET